MASSLSAFFGSTVAEPFPRLEDQVVVCAYMDKRLNREMEPPTSRLTLDVKEFSDSLPVVVMPYDGMKVGDTVSIVFSDFAISRISRETLLGDEAEIGRPVILSLPHDELAAHVGQYVELSASVNGEITSKRQTFFIIDEGEHPPLSKVPRFEGVTAHIIYANDFKDGATLIGENLIDAEAGDAALVFDEHGVLVAWQFLGGVKTRREDRYLFTITYEWLVDNDEKNKKLFVQYAGGNRAGRSLPLSFEVSQKRNLPDPALVSGGSFHDVRAGLVVSVPITPALSGGLLTMYVAEAIEDASGNPALMVHAIANAYREERGHYIFLFPQESLGVVLGRKNTCVVYEWFVNSPGQSERQLSSPTKLALTSPGDGDIKHFPKIQCEEYSGTVGLSLSRLSGAPVHVRVDKWLLMGVGQRIEIYAANEALLGNKLVDERDMKNGYVRAVVKNEVLVRLGAGKKLELRCEIVFNNGAGESTWLQPVVLSIVA